MRCAARRKAERFVCRKTSGRRRIFLSSAFCIFILSRREERAAVFRRYDFLFRGLRSCARRDFLFHDLGRTCGGKIASPSSGGLAGAAPRRFLAALNLPRPRLAVLVRQGAPLHILFPKNLCFANLFRKPCFVLFSALFLPLSRGACCLTAAPACEARRFAGRLPPHSNAQKPRSSMSSARHSAESGCASFCLTSDVLRVIISKKSYTNYT